MPAVIRPVRYRGEVLQMDLSAGGQIIRLDDDTHVLNDDKFDASGSRTVIGVFLVCGQISLRKRRRRSGWT